MKKKFKILLVSNLTPNVEVGEDVWYGQEEDKFLAECLRKYFDVSMADPNNAIRELESGGYSICLLRNAWPGREFEKAIIELGKFAKTRPDIVFYNPPGDYDFMDNKKYLDELTKKGQRVIPTTQNIENMNDVLGDRDSYVIKPVNGCSSHGVELVDRAKIKSVNTDDYVIQPLIDLEREMSFFFLDNEFQYAVRSEVTDKEAGEKLGVHIGNRWKLEEFQPTRNQVEWAYGFIKRTNIPHGIVRIDAASLRNGDLKLMEIERDTPLLSLVDKNGDRDVLSHETREGFLANLVASLKRSVGMDVGRPYSLISRASFVALG